MHVLVTGGAGFIGSHLIRALCQEGHLVRVLDLKLPDNPVPGVEYCRGDACEPKSVALAMHGIDAVYHLAATVSVVLCQEKPMESYRTNVLATAAVLAAVDQEQRRKNKQIRFIFASTSAVYGENLDGAPTRENPAASLSPISFYAAQKLASENMIGVFHRASSIPTLIFRLFNVYGPGQDKSSPYAGVITRFIHRICRNEPICLNGGGHQIRDFVSVHDVAAILAETCLLSLDKFSGAAVNLGTGEGTQIRDLALLIAGLSGKAPLVAELGPGLPSDIQFSCANVEYARKNFHWHPRITLKQGLRELIALETAGLQLQTIEQQNYVAPQIQY